MHIAQVRHMLIEALQRPVTDELWEYLVAKTFVREVLDGATDINYLADQARQVLRAGGSELPGKPAARVFSKERINESKRVSGDSDALRIRTISILIAHEAENDPAVQLFRDEVLDGTLLRHDEVEGWVTLQARRDGEQDWWLQIPVEIGLEGPLALTPLPKSENDFEPNELRLRPAFADAIDSTLLKMRYVEYTEPSGSYQKLQPIAAGGVLERLWTLSTQTLTDAYPWTAAQATVFVLTGLCPEIRSVDGEVRIRPTDAAARIILEIDPALTPTKVAEHYKFIRDRVLTRRLRAISDKHLRLAAFVEESPKDWSWNQRMHAWNAVFPDDEFPGFKYEELSNFRRDAGAVRRRLLDPGYRYPWTLWQDPLGTALGTLRPSSDRAQ